MKRLIFFISLFLLALQGRAQDTLWWHKDRPLTWEDFQAFPDTMEVFEALTYSGISFTYTFNESGFTFQAGAYFNRARSWRLPIADSSKLRHEQLHFDITELFTRRLKNGLKDLRPERSTVQKTIRGIVKQVLEEKDRMQHTYDQETHYGTRPAEQKKWERQVAELLKGS